MSKINVLAGILKFEQDTKRKQISIVSADQEKADAVALAVTSYLKEQGEDVGFIDKEYSMLAKALRVVKTQKGITMYHTTKAFLEAARDSQNYAEAKVVFKEGSMLIMPYCSIYTIMQLLLTEYVMRRRIMKWTIRRGLFLPHILFILQVDKETLFSKRKKFDKKHKVEDSQKGASFNNREKRDQRIADHISSKGGLVFRIDAKQASVEQVATVIINKIKESNIELPKSKPYTGYTGKEDKNES